MAVLPVASAPVEVREVDPATLKPGTRLVQFGAFDSPDQAKEHWGKLSATFGELMVGKAQVIQSAESGGRTFYRLRAEGLPLPDWHHLKTGDYQAMLTGGHSVAGRAISETLAGPLEHHIVEQEL